MAKKQLGDEVERLEQEKNLLLGRIASRDREVSELKTEVKLAGARERLRVIQMISGKEGE